MAGVNFVGHTMQALAIQVGNGLREPRRIVVHAGQHVRIGECDRLPQHPDVSRTRTGDPSGCGASRLATGRLIGLGTVTVPERPVIDRDPRLESLRPSRLDHTGEPRRRHADVVEAISLT